jgi:hypothetical protein
MGKVDTTADPLDATIILSFARLYGDAGDFRPMPFNHERDAFAVSDNHANTPPWVLSWTNMGTGGNWQTIYTGGFGVSASLVVCNYNNKREFVTDLRAQARFQLPRAVILESNNQVLVLKLWLCGFKFLTVWFPRSYGLACGFPLLLSMLATSISMSAMPRAPE